MMGAMTARALAAAFTALLAFAPGAPAAADEPQLAFVASERGGTRIALTGISGPPQDVSAGGGTAHSPAWSPDGRRLAYAAAYGGAWQIYVRDVTSRRTRRITSGAGDHIFPAWSPDGARIAYVLRRDGDEQIHLIAADGSGARRLTGPPGRSTVPVWSPDGRRIAFVSTRDRGTPQLFVMRPDGGGMRQLSRAEADIGRAGGRGGVTVEPSGVLLRPGMLHPVWSPDGSRIAYVTRVGRAEQQIMIVSPEGRDPRRLSTGYAPAWSPDGTRIAFVVARVGDSQLYVMRTDGTGLRRLTSSGANMLPAWSPDGRWLAFLTADERGLSVVVMRPDGSRRRRIGTAGGDLSMGPSLAWRP